MAYRRYDYRGQNNYYYSSSSSDDDYIDQITSGLSRFSLNQNRGYSYYDSPNRYHKILNQEVYKRNRMMRNNLPSSPLSFSRIPDDTRKWESISDMLPHSLHLDDLLKVNNTFLRMSFDLKRTFAYDNIQPRQLFHGTKQKHVDEICTQNFDWRLAGMERGHRFGKGVNFTASPRFAINFCDPGRYTTKVLILADVLVGMAGVGKENLKVPPKGCDTTMRENGSTFVKFYDAEFCPTYVLYVRRCR